MIQNEINLYIINIWKNYVRAKHFFRPNVLMSEYNKN